MPADNLEIFKKVIFRIPSTKKTFLTSFLLAFVYGGILSFLLEKLLINVNGWFFIPFIAFSLFLVPGIVSSELYHYLLPEYPRKWGYFLSLVNQFIIFLFSLLLTISETFITAWQIIWLGLTTLFLANFFVLVLSVGPEYMKRTSLLSMVQPLMILSGFHIALGRYLEIGAYAYFSNFLIVIGAGIVLILAIYITEFLVGSNISDISMFGLAAALLQNRQERLDLGRPVKPFVQTLNLENNSGSKNFLAPWIHPGPIQGFGGGKITSYLISRLNERGEGFFMHVPSCHQMDPADPLDGEKIFEAMKVSEGSGKASKLLKKNYDFFTIYGRVFGDQKIIFLDVDGFDDYESAIFQEVLDLSDTIVIDLHNQPKSVHGDEMRYGTVHAEEIRSGVKEFVKELENLDQHRYNAGFSVNFDSRPLMALVEEVSGQKTVFFGVEGNDASKELLEVEEELRDDFDQVLLFTTDTHSSIHDLASQKQTSKGEVRNVVEAACKDVSEATIGISLDRAEEMKVLKSDYYGLIYTINILVRLLPMTLVFLYILLAVWLL